MPRPASRLVVRLTAALLLSVGLVACGGGDGGGPTGPAAVAEVEISPPQSTIEVGETQPFSATVRDAGGGVLTGRDISWSVQSQSVATIDASTGLATGVGEGSTTVTATVEGVQGTAQLTVELGDFAPTSNAVISGDRAFASVNIPAGVTVTVTGPVVITVEGDATIDGTFTGDCHAIEFRVEGDFSLDGLLSNVCSVDPGGAGGGLTVVADGDMTIGSAASAEDAIVSDGTIVLTDSDLEDEDLEPLFDSEAAPIAAPAVPGPAQQAGGQNTTLNRPIRAMRGGSEVKVARTGDVTVNGEISAAKGSDSLPPKVDAAVCDNSNAFGGTGGSIRLAAQAGRVSIGVNVTLTAGDGGKGGDCTANAPAGESAVSSAGAGGIGGSIFLGGEDIVFQAGVVLEKGNGGPGGDAYATGGDGVAPCEDGFTATANGGVGGRAGGVGYILLLPGEITGEPIEARGNGGKGGKAEATGGNGADCECNVDDGVGGDGGLATANGGMGGNGSRGNVWPIDPTTHKKGEGGDAAARGGEGGRGADCCDEGLPGGDGGKGGNAVANGGPMGAAGLGGDSKVGQAVSEGGHGGHGGDGVGTAGAGGMGGVATSTGDPEAETNGTDGDPGELCPQLGGASKVTQVDTPVTVNLQFIDAQGDLPDLATLMVLGLDASEGTVSDVQITDVPVPLAGVFITFTFTPAEGFSGTADFQVKVQDETGDQSNLADVSVFVSDLLQLFELLTLGVSTTPGVPSQQTLQHVESSQNAGTMQVVGDGLIFESQDDNPGPRQGLGQGGAWFFDLWSLDLSGDPDAMVRQTQICFVNFFTTNPLVRIFLYGDNGGTSPPASPIGTQSPDVNRAYEVTEEGCGDVAIDPEDRWLVIQLVSSGFIDFLNLLFYITTVNSYSAG